MKTLKMQMLLARKRRKRRRPKRECPRPKITPSSVS